MKIFLFLTLLAYCGAFDSRHELRRVMKRQAEEAEANEEGSICNKIQESELFATLDACIALSDQAVLEAGGDIKKGLCESEVQKIGCWKRHLPACFVEDKVKRVLFNVVLDKMKKFKEQEAILGEDFARSCPGLRSVQSEFALELVGSDECSLIEISDGAEIKAACEQEALKRSRETVALRAFLSSAGARRTITINALCLENAAFRKCARGFKCYSEDKLNEILAKLDAKNDSIEGELSEILGGFTFKGSCSGF